MTESSFTIIFLEHMPRERWQYILDGLSEHSERIEKLNNNKFRIVCINSKQLNHVGWSLFHTHYTKMCKIIETSGEALPKAKAYTMPSKK